MTNKIFLTTTIPYVNARPHIGHFLEYVFADVVTRLERQRGNKVVFQSGTDENAFKNVEAAARAGENVEHFVERHSEAFRTLIDRGDIAIDTFVRTSQEAHRRGVHEFWRRLNAEDVYEKEYRGLYCSGCEDFVLEGDLIQGVCPDHHTRPEEVHESNFFFRLSKYQDQIEHLIDQDRLRIFPAFRKKEILAFVRRGLQDISLTRAGARAKGWGIPVPGRCDQVIYVWIDALVNYLSGEGFGTSDAWRDVWNDQTRKAHVIGKNVWKFHAVYWPALLLSAGIDLPDEIVIHGFVTSNGEKISKSLGNAVDPEDLISRFGVDATRHYFSHGVSLFQDSDYSEERFRAVYNSDLANTLGNLVSPLIGLRAKAGLRVVPGTTQDGLDVSAALARYDVDAIAGRLWEELNRINRDITEKTPWKLVGAPDHRPLEGLLQNWFNELDTVVRILSAFLPRSCAAIDGLLRDPGSPQAVLFPKTE